MISKGLEMGLQARPLFPVIWEERMEQNLDDLRNELGIEAVTEGPWSWHQNPELIAALSA
jgi:ubiquinone biosynthesis protein Coq4